MKSSARKLMVVALAVVLLIAAGAYLFAPHQAQAPTASQVLGSKEPGPAPSKKKFMGTPDF